MAKRGENIYKRKDGRYEGRYIKGREADGRPFFGYVYSHRYEEVKTALTLAKAASKQEEPVRLIGKGGMGEWLPFWLEHTSKEQVKPSTYAQYHERVYRHLIPALGEVPVSRLTRAQVQELVWELSGKGLAAATVSSIAGILCSAMKKAAELRLTMKNPCENLILPRSECKERRALDRAEQIRLEKRLSFGGESVETGVLLSLYAGLRIGEICALRWRDIDLFGGSLTVRGTLQRMKNLGSGPKTVLLEGPPKSRRSHRSIPLPAALTDKLRRRAKSADCYVLTGSSEPIEPRTLRARFSKLAAQAGLDIPFHSLRHTYATRCLELNFDVQTVSELLGHSGASTTMRVYAHSVFGHKRLLTERLSILSETDEPSNEPSEAYLL
jgi:integrase